MDIKKVWAVYFSPTGGTKKYTKALAEAAASALGADFAEYDYTLPKARERVLSFEEGELVFIGTPVYAGRVPNKLIGFVQDNFEGNGALGVPVAVYGNRSVDNGLIELRIEMENNGFHTIAGAALVSQHVMSNIMAAGRPDENDIAYIKEFGKKVADKVISLKDYPAPIAVKGIEPVPAYYTPLDENGQPAKFLKAKPVTDAEKCTECGICAAVCPMGSIDKENVFEVPGVCIKCQACVRKCPEDAKHFTDPVMLSHIKMLETNYSRRAENEVFI